MGKENRSNKKKKKSHSQTSLSFIPLDVLKLKRGSGIWGKLIITPHCVKEEMFFVV